MKAGIEFEQVVADIFKYLDPGAQVKQGIWEEGPDGRRNLDVVISGRADGDLRRIHVECKDYDPARGPIGISYVDAIESKHRDMNFDVSILCSNAGFTSGAISKAKRKNIALIGVLRADDGRIKYAVVDEVYLRRIEMTKIEVGYSFPAGQPTLNDAAAILYKGKPVQNWLLSRIPARLCANLAVKGQLRISFTFKSPIEVIAGSQRSLLEHCFIQFAYSGSWIAFESRIDASNGFYDWLKKTIRTGGPSGFSVSWKDVTYGVGGKPISHPPKYLFPNWPHVKPDGMALHNQVDIGGLISPSPSEIPHLNPLINEADLDIFRHEILEADP